MYKLQKNEKGNRGVSTKKKQTDFSSSREKLATESTRGVRFSSVLTTIWLVSRDDSTSKLCRSASMSSLYPRSQAGSSRLAHAFCTPSVQQGDVHTCTDFASCHIYVVSCSVGWIDMILHEQMRQRSQKAERLQTP